MCANIFVYIFALSKRVSEFLQGAHISSISFFLTQLQTSFLKEQVMGLLLFNLIIKLQIYKSTERFRQLIFRNKSKIINNQNLLQFLIIYITKLLKLNFFSIYLIHIMQIQVLNFYKYFLMFNNELQGRINNEIQKNNGDDSDNNSQESEDYYQYERKRMQMALSLLKTKTFQKSSILQQLKKNIASQIEHIQQFQDQVHDLHKITRNNQNNVLQQSVIKEIKQKVFSQSMLHTIQLADIQIQKKKSKQQAIEKQKQQTNAKDNKFIKKQQVNQVQNKLIKKMEQARMERQLLQMGRQDERSMKYEQQVISKFFQERFFTPQFKLPKNKQPIVKNIQYAPKTTITTLKPLPNTQNNVLPRNAPQLALRRLGRSKKIAFVPSSTSQVPVKMKKINPQQYNSPKETEQVIKKDQQEQIEKNIQNYLNFIKPLLPKLQQASVNYRPKFINQFPNQNQQNFNIDSQKSESRSIQDCLQSQKTQNIKDIKLTFEHITNLKGIDKYENIEQAALQFNAISNLNSIQNCKKLIQLNVSHNKIKNIGSLKNLKWLKILNIQHNLIDNIQLKGGSLQILSASNNRVQQIIDLSDNIYLKRLNISNNNLHNLGGLNKLYYLEQIDAHCNYINTLKGIQQCILLRKLNISNNRLTEFHENFTFIFLNKIIASGNSISQFPNMFLPSLEELYLDHNKIEVESQKLLYFPNLKLLNLDDNKLSGFCVVWSFIRYSRNLQTLKYDKNQYFMNVRQKVKQLYEHIIYKNMNKLQILNQGAFDIGIQKYYQGVYNTYLITNSIFRCQSDALKQIQGKILFVIHQNQCMAKLQDQKVKFAQSDIFVRHKSVKKAQDLMQIITFLNNTKIPNNKSNFKILHATKSLFYEHDKFQHNFRNQIHKIKNFIINKEYRNRKRKEYFSKNKNRLQELLIKVEKEVLKQKLIQVVKIFHFPLQKMGEQKAAIIIQKNWRCYRMRKKYIKVLAKLRKKSYLDDDMEDIDLDDYDFEKMQIPQFNFQLPEEMDFDQYIIKPQIFEMLNKQEQKRQKKMMENNSKLDQKKKKQQPNKNKKGGPNPMVNNFIENNESNVSQRNISAQERRQDDIQKLMKQWGINRQAALALATKNKMKQNQKKKLAQANMSAAERYQKFKKQHR